MICYCWTKNVIGWRIYTTSSAKMSSKKWLLLTIIIISLLVLRGCRDRVLPDRVINFTDSNTNKIISSVLVIPRYEVFWGMRNVEGGGSPVNYILLANPFIYHSDGSRFIS